MRQEGEHLLHRDARVVADADGEQALQHHLAVDDLLPRADRELVADGAGDGVGHDRAIHRGDDGDGEHVAHYLDLAAEVAEHADLADQRGDQAVARRVELDQVEEFLARLVALLHRQQLHAQAGLDGLGRGAVHQHLQALRQELVV